jgi:hypothetical protein
MWNETEKPQPLKVKIWSHTSPLPEAIKDEI